MNSIFADPGSRSQSREMSRADLTRRLVARLQRDEAVIGGIGHTNFDLWASGQRAQSEYPVACADSSVVFALSNSAMSLARIFHQFQ